MKRKDLTETIEKYIGRGLVKEEGDYPPAYYNIKKSIEKLNSEIEKLNAQADAFSDDGEDEKADNIDKKVAFLESKIKGHRAAMKKITDKYDK